jgi:glycerol-3-phosphate dehydrogenase
VEYQGDPSAVTSSQDEIDYLIQIVNKHFKTPISASDIVRTYSGVRPLLDADESDSAQTVSRDYRFEVDAPDNTAP